VVEREKCIKCGKCEKVCIANEINNYHVGPDLCTSCGACLWLCPTKSISFGGWNDDKWGNNKVDRK